MKTTLKPGIEPENWYSVYQLENKDEMLAIIQMAEEKLKPCPCCGCLRPSLVYRYWPQRKKIQHEFYIECGDCGIRSFEWSAEDTPDNSDIQTAIWFCFQKWNQRPGEPEPKYPFPPIPWQVIHE